MSSNKAHTESSNALNWFGSHPLVATVLWALGADVRDHVDKPVSGKPRTAFNRSLSWRDDRGGSIVDNNSEHGERVRRSNMLHSTRSDRQSSESDGITIVRRLNYPDSETTRDSLESESPQSYGFYVAISPPQEHLYPKVPSQNDKHYTDDVR